MVPVFEVGKARYRFNGMTAQTETRILKRFAPLMAEALPLILAPGMPLTVRADVDIMRVAQVVFGGWGKLSDDDTDMIERASLGSLSREHDGQWVEVWPKGDPEPAFADIDGAMMETLLGRALGLVVNNWLEGNADNLPVALRAALHQLH